MAAEQLSRSERRRHQNELELLSRLRAERKRVRLPDDPVIERWLRERQAVVKEIQRQAVTREREVTAQEPVFPVPPLERIPEALVKELTITQPEQSPATEEAR